MRLAEQIVDSMLEGRVKDWLSDRWNDVKAVTGIGSDSMGLGKNTEPGWKPKYGPTGTTFIRRKPPRRPPPDAGEKTWDITP